MKKVVIWGSGYDYDRYYNAIQCAVLLKQIQVVAIVNQEMGIKYIDGIKVIRKNDLGEINFDYLVVAEVKSYKEIERIAQNECLIDRDKIINGEVFLLPGFDFNKYIEIKEKHITIISEDCWGAYTYNYLGLQFTSPFISLHLIKSDYFKLLNNLNEFLDSKLEEASPDTNTPYEYGYRGGWPRGSLSDSNGDKVYLNFNHALSFENAKKDWERRKKRINYDDVFIKMTINSEENAYKFDALPFKNKIGFYYKELPLKSIVCLRGWSDDMNLKNKMGFEFYYYVLRCADKSEQISKPYDIFKQEFLRKM